MKNKTFKTFLNRSESELREGNDHAVPKKQWRKWGKIARQTFNGLYAEMMLCQRLFVHPKAVPVSDIDWKTTCWNAAWIAASTVDNAVEDSLQPQSKTVSCAKNCRCSVTK